MSKVRRTGRPATRRVWKRTFLRQWRESHGWSGEELAERSGVSAGQISLIENRRSAGSPETLERLADALGITVGDLLDIQPEMDRVMIRAWVKTGDRERFENVIKALDPKAITD